MSSPSSSTTFQCMSCLFHVVFTCVVPFFIYHLPVHVMFVSCCLHMCSPLLHLPPSSACHVCFMLSPHVSSPSSSTTFQCMSCLFHVVSTCVCPFYIYHPPVYVMFVSCCLHMCLPLLHVPPSSACHVCFMLSSHVSSPSSCTTLQCMSCLFHVFFTCVFPFFIYHPPVHVMFVSRFLHMCLPLLHVPPLQCMSCLFHVVSTCVFPFFMYHPPVHVMFVSCCLHMCLPLLHVPPSSACHVCFMLSSHVSSPSSYLPSSAYHACFSNQNPIHSVYPDGLILFMTMFLFRCLFIPISSLDCFVFLLPSHFIILVYFSDPGVFATCNLSLFLSIPVFPTSMYINNTLSSQL